ncbi:MAG: 6-carboxytetrahydropterin synthase [Proteobacteria bacterium]|nr:6-carboxytetrahydropterin synthase [Pseudomonadota bacterium]
MFAVEVRETIMVAHALPDPFFGPAAAKHGATYIVNVAFTGPALSRHNVVIDMGRAQAVVKAVLAPLHYQDLDALPQFAGVLTTTEFLCRHIHGAVCAAIRRGELGDGAEALQSIRVTMAETPAARAWYEAPVTM